MRGRLRVVRDYDKELDGEEWKLEAGVKGGKVIDYGLPNGRELPDYEGNRLSHDKIFIYIYEITVTCFYKCVVFFVVLFFDDIMQDIIIRGIKWLFLYMWSHMFFLLSEYCMWYVQLNSVC